MTFHSNPSWDPHQPREVDQFPYVRAIGRRRLWLSEATFHGHSRSRTSSQRLGHLIDYVACVPRRPSGAWGALLADARHY